jgi:hypothetical protein
MAVGVTEPCAECEASERRATFVGLGAGVLIGAGLCYLMLRVLAK